MSSPVIHPSVLALVCPSHLRAGRATQQEQSDGAGISRRHFTRIIREDWGRWDIPTAERWCRYCGVDFWQLSTTRIEPKALRLTDWTLDDPRVREAVELSCKSHGVQATPERMQQIINALRLAAQNYGSLGAPARS